jgi:UDP-N-acetylmuramate--alanine ligase
MKYHLIGNKGVSMRGIEAYLKYLGHTVTGSDLKTGGHKAENITPDIDVVVRTSAANDHSEAKIELDEARKLGLKIIRRSEMIQELTKAKELIAISGMHGKTTITAMAGLVLEAAGFDPTVMVGSDVAEFEGVIRIGKSNWFVLEACEYDRAFLDFYPKILILSNIEAEHLDTYPGGLPEIKEAFIEYVNHLPENGLIIACSDDKNVLDVLEKSQTNAKVIYYGFNSEKYNQIDFKLGVAGRHNVQNALSIIALADYLGIERKIVEETLSKFQGAKRRFELLGNFNGADLLDDYGHHPTEIKTTLTTLKEHYPDKKRIVVFWPHQYKRIKPLLNDFANSFKDADQAIIKPIFFVPGRDEKLDISSKDLVAEINKISHNAIYFGDDGELTKYLVKTLNKNCVLLTIGIPPVYEIIEAILKESNERSR